MKIVVKIGGTLVDGAASRDSLARQLAALAAEHQVALVHGGGKQMTHFLAERGIESRFVNGLRVTDAAVIDAASKVIAGSVNKQLVAALHKSGLRAVGLSGLDGHLTLAEQWNAELGYVGRPIQSNGALLDLLVDAGYLPVVACLAADAQGTIYNVNADQMAVSIAVAFRAGKLLFLTDVPGVKDRSGVVLPRLDPAEAAELVRSGAAYGGMQTKLDAACAALSGGIEEVSIAPGQSADVCAGIMRGEALGTRLTPAATGSPV